MPRETKTQWIRRVRQWARSGLDAKTFAAREGIRAGTLTWWRWRLGMGPRAKLNAAEVVRAERRDPTFVEVVLPAADLGSGVKQSSVALELFVGDHRVLVPPGFDENTLRRLLGVLEER